MTDLYCAACHKHMATLRDAKVRQGMVVYCAPCNAKMHSRGPSKPAAEMPEFLKGIFGGK